MQNYNKFMTILILTVLLGSTISGQMMVPAYATNQGQIHFFGHSISGKPTSYTSSPGFEINQCSPTGSTMVEVDLYLLNHNGGPNTVRLTMFSGTDGTNYPTPVAISSVDFKTETGISSGSVNTDVSPPFDVLVPASGETSPGQLLAQSDAHTHLKITFNANGNKYYQIHGDNINVNGKNSNAYFFYTNDPRICDGSPPDEVPVGGQIIPIDATALLLAGLSGNAVWMIPIFGASGSLFYLIKFRTK